MPKYAESKLKEYQYQRPKRSQHAPYPAQPAFTKSQKPLPIDNTPKLDAQRTKRIQKIIGAFLFYGRAVDPTILKALNSLSTKQSAPTEQTEKNVQQLLDYISTHPDAKIRYLASDMILQIHSDASYMNEPEAKSTAGGYFFLGPKNDDKHRTFLNGAIHTLCKIIPVAASAAEAELAGLFHNAQEAMKHRTTLQELGHPQPSKIW